jgi:hypothetical protein
MGSQQQTQISPKLMRDRFECGAAMILSRLVVFLCAAVAVFAALPAADAADKAPPTIDLQSRCRRTEKALLDMMGDQSLRGSAFDTCMRSEQDARKAIVAAWPDIPQSYKSFCIRKGDFSPSYVEWIACLEMMIDLRKQRAATGTKLDYVSKRCPAIQYGADGSIKSIKACPL